MQSSGSEKAKLQLDRLKEENLKLKAEIKSLRTALNRQEGGGGSIYHQAFNKASDALVLVRTNGVICNANDSFKRTYGIADPDGRKIWEMTSLFADEPEFEKRLRQIRDNHGQLDFQAQEGEGEADRHLHVAAAIVTDDNGEDVISLFLQDNTVLIHSRDRYRELNYLFETVLTALPVYLFVKDVDNDLRYLYWNKAFADHAQIPAAKAIGRTDFEIFPNRSDAEKFRADDLKLISTHQEQCHLETYTSASGVTRLVETHKRLVPFEGRGPLLIGVSWDITNMQAIEKELIQEKLRADQSDKLKSAFLANMSHEIRTPLNAIMGFSNLLAETDSPEEKEKYVGVINQNTELLLNLINDILDLSKIEAGTMEYHRAPMDLSELCRNVRDTLLIRVRNDVKLVFANQHPDMPVMINEDVNRLTQVFSNLISNACKFTEKGEITYGFEVKGKWINAYCSDTGIGIEPDKIDQVFDRFAKLNDFAQGTGLGLPICKMIIDKIGGKISVESVAGQGTTFRFTIPYRDVNMAYGPSDEPHPLHHEKLKAYDDSDQKPTILVADDIDSNFMLVEAILGKGYNLIRAKDGTEALLLFKNVHPDLILMDIKMPNIDGIEATRLIRSYSASVPIVALSAYAFDSDRQRALDAGVNDFITKPFHKADLERAAQKWTASYKGFA